MTISEQTVRNAIRQAIAEILPDVAPEQVDESKHLADLGADSVDRVEIILHLTSALDVAEPLSAFGQIPTIAALIDHLTSSRRSA
ncbi:MAG: acyl carrier protein [Mycobacterium sp.]|nr:acyl carrier protein [Mycobacterium sp.]